MLGLLAAVLVSTPVSLARVPTSTGAACPLLEGAAAFLETRPSVWVERAPDPDFAANARRWSAEPDGGWSMLAAHLEDRFDVSAPTELAGWVAPSPDALVRACAEDQSLWVDLGPALTPAVLRAARTPPRRPRSPSQSWARAIVRMARGERFDLRALARMARALETDDLPIWVRNSPRGASELAGLASDTAVLFERGVFVALDPDTGLPKWEFESAVATPDVTWVNGRPLLVTRRGVLLMDAEPNGSRAFFDLTNPHEEVALNRYGLFVGNEDEVWAIDPKTASVRWRHAFPEPAISGPVVVGTHLYVPHQARIRELDVQTGRLRSVWSMPEEVSAPLRLSAPDWVWASLGSRQLAALRPPATRVVHRVQPLRWPYAAAGANLFALSGSPGRSTLWRLDPVTGPSRVARVGPGPLASFAEVEVIHGDGAALVARDSQGRVRWREGLARPARALSVGRDLAWVAVGDRAERVDPKGGEGLGGLDLEATVTGVLAHQTRGLARTGPGRVYGLPLLSDPRRAVLRRFAQRAHAEGLHRVGADRRAAVELKRLVERHPTDRPAAVLRARISGGAAPWVAVASWAPDGSRLLETVQDNLQARDLRLVERSVDPVELEAIGDCRIYRSEEGIWALTEEGPSARLPDTELHPGPAASVRAGDMLIDCATGQVRQRLDRSSLRVTPAGVIELTPGGVRLPRGARVELERPRLRAVGPNAGFVFETERALVWLDPVGTVQYRAEGRFRDVRVRGPLLLLRPDRDSPWRLSSPASDETTDLPAQTRAHRVVPFAGGFLLWKDRELRKLGLDGRLSPAIRLARAARRVVPLGPDTAVVHSMDDSVRWVDLERRLTGPRLDLDVNGVVPGFDGGVMVAVDNLLLGWTPTE